MNCCSAAVFLSVGATLIPLFLGADVIAIAVAFLVSFAAGRQIERVAPGDVPVIALHAIAFARDHRAAKSMACGRIALAEAQAVCRYKLGLLRRYARPFGIRDEFADRKA